MASRNTNSAERLEYDDDNAWGDINVEPNVIVSYLSEQEEGLDDSFEGLVDDDTFLSIWEKSSSDESFSGDLSTTDLSVACSVASRGLNVVSSSESDDFDKDEDLSENEYDFGMEGGYSSDDMLSEESESSSCPSEYDSLNLSNMINSRTRSKSTREGVSSDYVRPKPLSNSRDSLYMLELERSNTNIVCDENEYDENNELNLLMGDADLNSEMNEVIEMNFRSKRKIQQRKLGDIHAEEDSSDLKGQSTIFDVEFGDIKKEHKEERFASSDESLPQLHSLMTSRIDRVALKRAEPAQILHTSSLNHQHMGNFSDKKRMILMIDNQDDERSIASDQTQKVRNTSAVQEGSSTSTFDSSAYVEEQWTTNCTAPILVELTSEKQALSLGNEPYRYKPKSNQTRHKRSRLFYLYFTIGIVAIATSVFVGTLFGLRKDIEDNKTSTEETKMQETSLPSTSPSPAPTISLLQLVSARQHEIFRRLKSISGASILNAKSPQHAALRLILDEDVVHLHISDGALIQRYSIAVLIFSWKLENVISAESECTWNGILCINDVVNKIMLNDSKLIGSIPNELSQLTSLVTVDLSNNLLRSALPSEIGALTSLSELLLNGNGLTSPIPTKFGQLKRLTVIDIGDNYFAGDLLTNKSLFLPSLTNLNLSGNRFSGTIPKNLHILCPSMVQLDINSNFLTGTIPTELGNLMSLSYLSISSNNLDGSLPGELFIADSKMRKLDLSSNDLSGSIPHELFNAMSITYLSLEYNSFSSNIPSHISLLSNLEELYLSFNSLTGLIPSSLGSLTNLHSLKLDYNDLIGSMPTEVCKLRVVHLVDLSSDCSGTLPKIRCKLDNCCTFCVEGW